ncbi:hypothetical protein [Aphanothece sacrum]|uniref:Cytochrome b n=1 Tax=Aphanothece sacrum FPU1 TaxID=1920663 RepID=A0A401ILH7_APHSA|nr:hypothetical protein [Aphanothece sacrum]GBF82110.1 cytochrome b [Aphanothece sacrum FPU1]GBF85044.1 cytochrome b [Aphanothece sacrum FPU3]
MFDIVSLGEFSRSHCIGICAFLVPANLLTTLLSLIFVVTKPPRFQLLTSVMIGISFAMILLLHVASWWIVGVVKSPTFILLALGTVCIGLNSWVIMQSKQDEPWLSRMVKRTAILKLS